ncbi:pseudaminic acid cytidylyltransferase [Shewanella sp. NFH-SH190041]|uniref:pseudaminic acid cytidylyltransferase n=1 Tax=Shewanella sp. NFH-SH190041 TaxID=2950245 RepID=UPI0021C4A0AE|nr:pseudaminic acid cytidylyltransferase [Shewanella sp. NFH-SH190041]BDM63729.1 pseudaminic acid cytidylyltransferase [Shewanella sp. NFH-SH190041]
MTLAIIPARGGSQRIANKNIRAFLGRPLLAYSIDAAWKCGLFERVIVSTDSDEIAAIARDWGAEVPFMRPAALADGMTGTTAVMRHALSVLAQTGPLPSLSCCLYATAPLLQIADLRLAGLQLQAAPEVDFIFAATEYDFAVQRGLITDEQGGVQPREAEFIGCRSQDLPQVYHDAGQFYWGRSRAFLADDAAVFGPASRLYLLPRRHVVDIDTEADWQEAEIRAQILRQQGVM